MDLCGNVSWRSRPLVGFWWGISGLSTQSSQADPMAPAFRLLAVAVRDAPISRGLGPAIGSTATAYSKWNLSSMLRFLFSCMILSIVGIILGAASTSSRIRRRLQESVKSLLRTPLAEEMTRSEETSLKEFVDIWYSENTWKNLQQIKVAKWLATRGSNRAAGGRCSPAARSARRLALGGRWNI